MGQRERVLSLEHDGVVYNLTPLDFTALDDLAIFEATGGKVTLQDCFGFGGKTPSLAAVAALVWRYRVNDGEEDLRLHDVMRTFTYDAMRTVSGEERDDADPKASAVS